MIEREYARIYTNREEASATRVRIFRAEDLPRERETHTHMRARAHTRLLGATCLETRLRKIGGGSCIASTKKWIKNMS